jgi:TetR/AcrR family transcriptional regulator, fatty acid biosynthesis regulator
LTVVNKNTASVSRPARRPQARTAQTRERLLAAARDIVAEVGLAGLRTDAVVARAATAKGTFFAHFPDKDHLLALLLAEELAVMLVDLPPLTTRKALTVALDRIFGSFADGPETIVLLSRFSGQSGAGLGLDVVICDIIARLAHGLAALQAQGRITSVADPAVLAEGLVAFLFHAAASAQCPAAGDGAAARERAEALLHRLAETLLWPSVVPG